MLTVETTDVAGLPAPRTLEEAGLGRDLVSQLVLKTLHFAGELTGTELARRQHTQDDDPQRGQDARHAGGDQVQAEYF